MNNSSQELSNLSKHFFESECLREQLSESKGTSSLFFRVHLDSFQTFQEDFHKNGIEETWQDLEKKFGRSISTQERKNTFRHIFERENYDELIDLKQTFSIKLFKELSIGSKSLKVDQDAFEILDRKRQIIKDADQIHSRVIMRPGDIDIVFKDSLELSTSVKQFETPRKNVPRVIVKGEDCFLQTKTPDGFLADDLLTIELATQEDIKNVFELMNKIL